MADLAAQIEELWARRDELSPGDADARAVVHEAIGLLDRGEVRVAVPDATEDHAFEQAYQAGWFERVGFKVEPSPMAKRWAHG